MACIALNSTSEQTIFNECYAHEQHQHQLMLFTVFVGTLFYQQKKNAKKLIECIH